MSEGIDDFFEGKRPWSHIKDEVLRHYMDPYLAKVNRLKQPILLIDGYAGPGVFDDGTIGSPLIICEKAELRAKGNYKAIFINKDKEHHEKLYKELHKKGWLTSTQLLLGDSRLLLQRLPKTFKKQTVFLYLDPFGPTGCDFALLQPFLERDQKFSTEILLTMNMPGMHRFAAPNAVKSGRENEQMIQGFHQKLTNIFGGTYWKDILWKDIDAEERELQLIRAYESRLAQYLPFTGSCPVREKTDRRIKYFIVFASRRKDTMILLNDIMVKAYFASMHKADFTAGLWEDTDWREMRSIDGLDSLIIELVTAHPGNTRKSIWSLVVEKRFMRYLETEYRSTVKHLVDTKKLTFVSKTGQLNDDCLLYLVLSS